MKFGEGSAVVLPFFCCLEGGLLSELPSLSGGHRACCEWLVEDTFKERESCSGAGVNFLYLEYDIREPRR